MIAYDRLSQIVPSDQALAAKAMSVALQQISGITNMTLPVLANVVVGQQTTNNLTLIADLTQAVPTSVARIWPTSEAPMDVQWVSVMYWA